MLKLFHSPEEAAVAEKQKKKKRQRRIPGEPIHEGTYQEILKLRKEIWITVRDLKDYLYNNEINEEIHIQNRTLNSILAKHSTCSDLNALFKMHLDAKALQYQYEKKLRTIPDKKSQKNKR
ncbi:33K [Turkey adenovirus 3]|uniref:33K n=1 Tax=Turkey adenovirus 3 TaxID=41678 RepID=A0A7G9UL71_9ADEN|nr:33K [Turkey adenovirus 3]